MTRAMFAVPAAAGSYAVGGSMMLFGCPNSVRQLLDSVLLTVSKASANDSAYPAPATELYVSFSLGAV